MSTHAVTAGAWTGETRWHFDGRNKRTATLANGAKAIVWRTPQGVTYSIGKVVGYPTQCSLLARCAWLAREARREIER